MGVVYKAHDAVLDRQVAIKQMAAELDDEPQLRQRFSQEARAAARLNHRNIITIYELHESDDQLYMVMELLEGVDLATIIKRRVDLPLEAKVNLLAQVCDGLDYAHGKGIIHRDIKPANLHVSPAGVLTILDFGIARLAQSKMTGTGGLIGTPDYMSPEQVMAGSIDARSDLFAVGAVAYELLSGARPFDAESVTALLMKIAREPHVPLRARAPRLPDPVILLVERLLQKDPDHRPSTAREVRQALLSIATDRPPMDAVTVSILASAVSEEARRPGTPPPPSRPPKSPTGSDAARADSSSRLASLAIERGRALREAGDLSGAMRVFRSVLGITPGNPEALAELEEMERAIARITASGRPAPGAPVPSPGGAAAEPPVEPARVHQAPAVEPTSLYQRPPAPPAIEPPPVATMPEEAPTIVRPTPGARPSVPPRRASSSQAIAFLAVGAVLVIVLSGAALYLWSSRPRERIGDSTAGASGAVTGSVGGSAGASLTTSSVPPPPAVTSVAATPVVAEPPAVVEAPPPTTTSVAPVIADPAPAARQRPPREASAPDRVAADPPPAPAETGAAVAPPPPSNPPPPAASAPAAPEPAAVPSVMVRHFHARALFRGGGYCEGPLELRPDGLYFKTTGSSDGRTDEKLIPFTSVEDFELDGDKIHIETDDKNWDFGAPKDVLKQIEALLKAKVKA